jgi:hypothetical protein
VEAIAGAEKKRVETREGHYTAGLASETRWPIYLGLNLSRMEAYFIIALMKSVNYKYSVLMCF